MKRVRGYIFSRPFLDERAPQHVQNIIIRDFCKKKSYHYLLSASEYRMGKSYSILESLTSNSQNIDGIIVYSLLMLPEKQTQRTKILKKFIRKKKFFCFAVEDITVKNSKDIKTINDLWRIKKALKNAYQGK